jgi:tripartite-type tricarboxylate transporter receptor subunit TctC
MLSRTLFTLAATALLAVTPLSASAQSDFPNRPIKIIIPTPPGGGNDNIARPLSEIFHRELGQTAVIEARTGAAGAIALEALARAPKDGYTLLVSVNASVTIVPQMRKLSFDAEKDVAPVAMLVDTISAVGIKPSLPVKTFKEFIEYCRAHPGEVHFGGNAPGGATHVRNEMLNRQAKLGMVYVPYKGDSEIMNDLLAGVIDFAASSSVLPFTKGGQVRLIAFMAAERHPDYPDIPTVKEFVPEFNVPTWYGLYAPGGTPKPIIDKLNAVVAKGLASPELKARLIQIGMVPRIEDVPTFTKTVADDRAIYKKIIADLDIKGD